MITYLWVFLLLLFCARCCTIGRLGDRLRGRTFCRYLCTHMRSAAGVLLIYNMLINLDKYSFYFFIYAVLLIYNMLLNCCNCHYFVSLFLLFLLV
ncbi:hypothetical protein T492DRAFT_34731 [Pavlovales sp. CCMP2436]|nr:hypothetical protein T492DRAFT_34731 [Pavlovales sp. CCMP2436]